MASGWWNLEAGRRWYSTLWRRQVMSSWNVLRLKVSSSQAWEAQHDHVSNWRPAVGRYRYSRVELWIDQLWWSTFCFLDDIPMHHHGRLDHHHEYIRRRLLQHHRRPVFHLLCCDLLLLLAQSDHRSHAHEIRRTRQEPGKVEAQIRIKRYWWQIWVAEGANYILNQTR